ncbi:hypothetical protein Glove_406g97 [Diversispora epigaea]|uniref:Uncharacterized protein n=1 Tax=Diversispora epigaea TaxID=1348612 RepID=A0A397GZN0_9GLOM|nr:hypothetical protein Glove_406g97 [Diversispora epigaea]
MSMLSKYNIKQGGTLHLLPFIGGGLNLEGKFDVTEIKLRNKLTFFFHIFFERKGYCKNCNCKAYNKDRVIVRWGYRDFDFYYNEHECLCPLCNKHVEPITCGFYNTHWKYEGVKKVKGCPPCSIMV